jgi:ABC-type molybdenum transport system ATPase subunit/photorepair protein PhrA
MTPPDINPYDIPPSVIGYLDAIKDNAKYSKNNSHLLTIPYDTRQNMVIFGEIGSGKSSILRLLILQDIQAKRGFLIIENHTELSRGILSLIPEDQRDKIVYVNLSSLRHFEKTLRFNPLENKDPRDAGMVALNFTECMARAFADSWGARVETCTRNGALGVIGTASNTIGVMLKLLTDEKFR